MKKQMKKKMVRGAVLFMVTAALSLSLAGCGDSGTSTTAAPQSTEEKTEQAVKDPLGFVNSGEIYFDIQLGNSATVSVDGQKVTGNTAAYKKGAEISIDGLDAEGSSDYIAVYSTKDGNEASYSFFVGKGADNAKLSEILSKKLAITADKVFLSVYESGKTWNKSLSDDLNSYIEKNVK